MEIREQINLLAEAQNAIVIAKSEPVGDESFVIRKVKMRREDYLKMHNVHPRNIHKAVDSLVSALKTARHTMSSHVPWAEGHRLVHVYDEIDAALALARGGK